MAAKKRQGLRFDWYPVINEAFIHHLVDELIANIENFRKSSRGLNSNQLLKRTEETKQIAKHVISALYISFVSIPIKPKAISFPKSKQLYSLNQDVNKINYSAIYSLEVLEALKRLKWVNEVKGIERVAYTRITPIGKLSKKFYEIGLRWFKQEPLERSKLVVLRDFDDPTKPKRERKKINLPVPDNSVVNKYRDFLYQYNVFITKHCIAFELDDDQLNKVAKATIKGKEKAALEEVDDKESEIDYIDFSRVQLRRIFARGSLEKGGRFYGAWYQSIPSLYRQHITIDDKTTCEVDFSGMSLRIVYALKGIELPLEQDPYDIGLEDWKGSKDPRRKHIKTYINAVLNDEVGRYRLSSAEQRLTGLTHNQLSTKFKEKHHKIADVLNTDIGLTTQFYDSQIAVRVMQTMMKDNIVVLPIHDSFIVTAGYQQWLTSVMLDCFYEVLGSKVKTTVAGSRHKEHFEMKQTKVDEIANDIKKSIGNVSDLGYKHRPINTLGNYVGYWHLWKDNN